MKLLGESQRKLFVELTDDEVAWAGNRAATLNDSVLEVAEERKRVAKEMKDRIDELEKERNQRLVEVRTRRRAEYVDVQEFLDFGASRVIYVRIDTGEEIGRRRASDDEMQLELLPTSEAEAAAK